VCAVKVAHGYGSFMDDSTTAATLIDDGIWT
jgi:hypothetical protein